MRALGSIREQLRCFWCGLWELWSTSVKFFERKARRQSTFSEKRELTKVDASQDMSRHESTFLQKRLMNIKFMLDNSQVSVH